MKEYIEHLNSLTNKQLVLMLAKKRQSEISPLAVVGTGCRLPGGVNCLDQLWQTLVTGTVHVKAYADGPPGALGKPRWPSASVGGYLNRIDQTTNPLGLTDDELLYTDPQHRLLMDCTLDALHQAGLNQDSLRGEKVGIFVGISTSEYLHAMLRNGPNHQDLSAYMGTGTALSAAPSRISMLLGSEGPCMSIDTACSSALSALHQAKQALRRGECDWAIVGASHLLLSPFTEAVFDKAGMLSKQGVARVFDEQADGHVRGEGASVLLLTRKALLSKALWSDISPLAWILGSAIHQQGQRSAMSISTGKSQQTVIKAALEDAQLEPDTMNYVEAHATGSQLGAQVELENLQAVYQCPLYVGSVKPHFGHLEPASGMLGILKTITVLQHRTVPAQINFETPGFSSTQLRIPAQQHALPAHGDLYASVSSFGFTGSNAHVVLRSGESVHDQLSAHRSPDATETVWPEMNYWS